MSYDECEDWYDNGPGSVRFGREVRREMREYAKKDPFPILNEYSLNFALSNDELTDELRKIIRDRYIKTAFDYEKQWQKWPPDEEIEPLEDELFKV